MRKRIRGFSGVPGRTAAVSFASLTAILSMAHSVRAETLADAIALAYQTNPELQSERDQLRAVNESYVQARAGFRPQVGVSVEGDYQNNPSTFFVGVTDSAASLSLTQPLYTGGAVSAEVRAAMADILSTREKLRQEEADVLQAVIQAYVDVRRDQQAVTITDQNVGVLRRQLEETNARFDAGDVTRTDIALAEARLAAAQAERTTAQARLEISRSNYTAVVGQNPGELAPEPDLPGVPATIDQALDEASRSSPLILTADYAEQAASARVALAKAANRPTVSLRAQLGEDAYYSNDARLGIHNGIYDRNVTASVVFNQPLFVGGANQSHIRQALDLDNAQLMEVEHSQRNVVQAVGHAWAQLVAARANFVSNAEQVRADEVAYEGTHAEQQVGQRTTIDVLNAEQELRNAQLALIDAHHDEYVAGASVLNAMGLLRADLLAPGIIPYSPEAAFDSVKHAGAVPWEGLVAAIDSIGAPAITAHPPAQLVQPSAAASVIQPIPGRLAPAASAREPSAPVAAARLASAPAVSAPDIIGGLISGPTAAKRSRPPAGTPRRAAARPPPPQLRGPLG
jgi:outer membrane protein